ncbi:MAG: hypothetical protein GXP25_10695 [Planctomycetes bacterium]|nr:hypothetical protein [Planctomycetota bacterium]
MKILVDENIPRMTVKALRELGHDVLDVRGTEHEGSSDHTLWDIAQEEKRLIITTDKGFSDRRQKPHFGILVVRLRQPNRHRIHERVLQALAMSQPGEWRDLLVVMRDRARSAWRRPTRR